MYGGEWKDNKMNGKGEYRYPNGDKYIGRKYLKYYLGYFVKDKK